MCVCVCVCVSLRMHVTWAQYSIRHTNETKSWLEVLPIPPSMCRARTTLQYYPIPINIPVQVGGSSRKFEKLNNSLVHKKNPLPATSYNRGLNLCGRVG